MPSWNWGESQSEDGVVHQSTANTDHNDTATLKQGYDYAHFSEITPDPVASYPLHEDSGTTAYDVAGTNDGTVNGATVGQTGLLGTTAHSFDQIDDNIALPDAPVLNFGTGSFTISAWVYASTGAAYLLQKGASSTNKGYNLLLDDNVDFKLADGTNFLSAETTTTAFPENEWAFVTGVYDNSVDEARAYVNANLEATDSGGVGDTDNTNQPHIGSNDDKNDLFYGGRVFDFRFYNTALTATQIQTLYDVVATQGTWTGTAKPL